MPRTQNAERLWKGPEPKTYVRGMTLVEVLLSVVILASATVLILQALARGAVGLAIAANRSRAYAFASTKLADVELSFAQGLNPAPKGNFRMGDTPFHWELAMSQAIEDPELQVVTLTVDWNQGRGEYASQFSLFQNRARDPRQ